MRVAWPCLLLTLTWTLPACGGGDAEEGSGGADGASETGSADGAEGDEEADGCGFSNAVDEGVKAHFPSWKFAPCVDGFHYTNPVGHFTSNPWGIHDMPGNLWEWTLDCWNDSHVGAPGDGSARETGACERRVIRGGAWDDEHEDLRSANRLAVPAERRYNTIGIRVVTE